ncbi:DUF4760 domain-containing protein [Amycolatopsis vastitatis]|uniref:DUF4760 domain-containing protein n=1 Tax=Amycolatopsis vastitatis TaxID=1905142 RepID=A0A229SME5_9PSEU|nr:hypothetical protein [Amycolatopsis vastitatis]OXM59964.1 hypothetical protein CF165_45335 [Amycolatopsis vastitatis]
MMNLLVPWISLLASIGAVGVAVWATRRNSVSLLKANSLRVTTEIFQQVRSAEFREHLAVVFAGIGEEPSEEGGIDHLSAKHRDSVYTVCYFFDYLGVLLAFGMIEKDVVLSALGTHIMRAWYLLQPYIMAERVHRRRVCPVDAPAGFLVYFEYLVVLVRKSGGRSASEVIVRRLGLPRLDMPAVAATGKGVGD